MNLIRIGYHLPQILKLNIVRHLSTLTQSDYETVYKFPYIRGVALINRLKLYQTALTTISMPSALLCNYLDLISNDAVIFTGVVALAGIIPLYGVGFFASKLIGFVYINENKNLVKLSYVDFWGSRRDVVIPLNEIVPFSESTPSLIDTLYLKVKRYESKNELKICTRYGILNDTSFNKIFLP